MHCPTHAAQINGQGAVYYSPKEKPGTCSVVKGQRRGRSNVENSLPHGSAPSQEVS